MRTLVYLYVTLILHFCSRNIVFRINLTAVKFGFIKRLELGPILPTDTVWYEN
jgi:hypothetical protein